MRYLLMIIFATIPLVAEARDTVHLFPAEPVLSSHTATNREWEDIAVFLRGQKHPPIVKTLGEWRSHRKTHSIFRSDEEACRIAFLSAVMSLQKRAWKEGGNAVVNVRSYDAMPGATPDYRCIAGATNAGVRLRGDVVRIDDIKLAEFRKQKKSKPQLPANAPYPVTSVGAFTKRDFRKAADPTTGEGYYEINLLNEWQRSTLTDAQYNQLPD